MSILLSSPTFAGEIKYSSFYQPIQQGTTLPVLLIGHADAEEMETPFVVNSMRAAIDWLGADQNSPLLRGLLELYNMGCRDIILYAAAPMSEYVSDISDRNTVKVGLDDKTYYEKYYERLTAAYSILSEYEIFNIAVPLEISFCAVSGIDFVTPLASFCEAVFSTSSTSVIGVIGSRAVAYDSDLIDEIIADETLSTIGDIGKNVIAILGEGIVVHSQMSQTYSTSYAAQVAALMSTVSLSRSIIGLNFKLAAGLAGLNIRQEQIERLAQAKINVVSRTQRGKRGQSFQTRLLTDNTLAPTGSDYWSLNQVRLVSYCANGLKKIANFYIGTNAQESFKQTVYDYMELLYRNGTVNGYGLAVKLEGRKNRATVDVSVTPIFSIRNIYFSVEVGPGL